MAVLIKPQVGILRLIQVGWTLRETHAFTSGSPDISMGAMHELSAEVFRGPRKVQKIQRLYLLEDLKRN
jgi:hypothetical protein